MQDRGGPTTPPSRRIAGAMNRRGFLRLSVGAALLAPGVAPRAGEGGPRRLVVIFLRGAVDGLNVVIPHGERGYYESRPTIAIGPPGTDQGALPLDGHFGLHPALAGLLPLWNDRKLAFVHAAGSSDATHSHFDAQLYVENGTPGRSTTRDGWMNRLLAALPEPRGPTAAVSIGPTLSQILKGDQPVANLSLGPDGARPMPIDQPEIGRAFDRLYARGHQSETYRQGRMARRAGRRPHRARRVDSGTPAGRVRRRAVRLARLIASRHPPGFSASAAGIPCQQGREQGPARQPAAAARRGLRAARGLGSVWDDAIVVVLSEFGRRVRENGNSGTDQPRQRHLGFGRRRRGGRVALARPRDGAPLSGPRPRGDHRLPHRPRRHPRTPSASTTASSRGFSPTFRRRGQFERDAGLGWAREGLAGEQLLHCSMSLVDRGVGIGSRRGIRAGDRD